jgi:hypothetical protein
MQTYTQIYIHIHMYAYIRVQLLAACAEGKNPTAKIKCQSLMKFDTLMEAILDLELLDR